jgi:hypothetical protein
MATITITIPDEVLPDLVEALTEGHYEEVDPDGQPNPQSKGSYARRRIINFLKAQYKQYKVNQLDRNAVLAQAEIDMDSVTIE